ncbi:MCE family protein [Aeromicrobium alkaliterrae]|uniref:MCE family protein n=1 Tax=Aeromicrobium alkaliterrae TaxID=302168 RepID=A0ABP4VKS1_9ACTN
MTAAYISRDLEQRQGTLVRRGLATVVVLALLVAGFLAVQSGTFSSRVDVAAQVDDVGGALAVGNDVKLRGAIIGRVTSIRANDGGVRLQLRLDPDEAGRLPAGVTARILPATVFGTSFVDLVPPERISGTLRSDAVIAQDPSSRTRELQDALDASFEILTAVEPARLSTTLGAFAQALDGRGESLGASLVTLDSYLTRLEPQLPQVGEDLRLLATNLATVAEIAPDLLDALESSFVTTQTVVDHQADLASVLTGGDDLVDEAHVLISDTQPAFVKAVTQSAPLVETMFDRREGFAQTFDSLVQLATIGATSFTDPDAGATSGGYLETTVEIVVNTDAPYTAADCAVFGPPAYRAAAASCGGATSSPASSPADDAALVAEIQGLLTQLESVADSDPNGIGDLLTRGFVDGGGGA